MSNPLPVLGGKQKFSEFLQQRRNAVDEVIIAMPAASTELNMHIMAMCQEYGVPFKFVPLPIHENIDHDLYYIAHQTLLLDISIIFQTIWFALIRGVGAR